MHEPINADQSRGSEHAETGRKCIYLGDHAWHIAGMADDAGRDLIEERQYDRSHARLHPQLARRRCGGLGQPLHAARAATYDTCTAVRVLRRYTITGEVPF